MFWYDIFSGFYSAVVEPHYRKYRKTGVESLKLKDGDFVLDLACGTGPNFKYLSPFIGAKGMVIGLDYSKGMIRKSKKEVTKNGWKNIQLVQENATKIKGESIEEICGRKIQFDSVICVLGFSVIPEYRKVFENTFDLLKPNGRYAIVDIYADRFVPQKWYVELIARADLERRPWELLESKSEDFTLTYLSKNRHLHGGLLYLASGKKPMI